jgi:hypothetical protein
LVCIEIGEVVRLGRQVNNGAQRTLGREDQAPILLEPNTRNHVHCRAALDVPDNIEQGLFTLAFHHDVHAIRLKRLFGEQRRMPSPEHHRELRIPSLYRPCNLYCFADHRPGNKRYPETKRVPHLFEHRTLEVRCDRRINQLHFVPRP